MNTATKIIVSIGSIAVIATAGIGGFLLATSNSSSMPSITGTVSQTTTPSTVSAVTSVATTSSTTSPSSSSGSSSTSTSSGYKDGTYTASSSYNVPHGNTNSMSATVTVSGGNITAVSTNNNYSDGESAMYVDSFKSSVSSAAVGSSLANASFSRIGGASLTTQAFDSVLDQIRTQATA